MMDFAFEIHGFVGIVPIAYHAKAFELFALNVEPACCVFAAALSKFAARHVVFAAAFAAKLFFDFPFNRQAVAIPARYIIGVKAHHLVAARHHIFEDFIHGRAHMNMAIGVRRAVMQGISRLVRAVFAQGIIKIDFVPMGQPFRLFLGQACPHRKIGFRKE